MKLIYQHILSFLVIILTSTLIIGFSAINYEKSQAYQNNFARMEEYAANLSRLQWGDVKASADSNSAKGRNKFELPIGSEESQSQLNPFFLQKLTFVMRDEGVKIFMMDKDFSTTYPVGGYQLLKPAAQKLLKSGQVVRIKNDHGTDQQSLNPKLQGQAKLKSSQKQSSSGRKHLFATASYTWVIMPQFVKTATGSKKFVGAIMVGSQVKDVMQPVDMAKANLGRALVITFVVSLILSFILAYYQTGRIKRLSVAARQVASGDLTVQVPHRSSDEIDELAENFDEMVVSLKKSNEEIKAQEKRRDQFMQDVAHEMRTPLTTINGLLEGLAYDAIPEESIPQSSSLMQRETKRLIRLVNKNLDYERIRTGKSQLTKSKFNASVILGDLKQQMLQNAQKNGNVLEVDAPDEIMTYADQDRFKQIMVNLTQNAIQFTKNGKIVIKGWRVPHGSRFSVADNGIGMSPDQTKYIFERFYKADPARARYGGTGESGLGLSIVLSLIRQHGGEIKVDSELDKGSTFTITLYDQGFEKKYSDDN